MNTKKKWLIFWTVFLALIIGGAGIILTGNFPQFTIPFGWFASGEEKEEQQELPKLAQLNLKDISDPEILTQSLDKVSEVNTLLDDRDNLASSSALTEAMGNIYGEMQNDQLVFNLYRTLYSAIYSDNTGFVEANLLGFGKTLHEDKMVTVERQLWTFADAAGNRHDFQLDLIYNDDTLLSLTTTADPSDNTNIITADDTYLDKTADFETAWSDIVSNNSDEQLFQQMNKDGLNPDQTEFQALEKEVDITDKNGFYDLFVATRGDLRKAYLESFFNTNSPTDGLTTYTYRVPTSQTDIESFTISYDRLNAKILSISKN